jgi:hypothetical protein
VLQYKTFQDVVQSKKYGKNCFNRVVLYFEIERKTDGRLSPSSSGWIYWLFTGRVPSFFPEIWIFILVGKIVF